MGNYTCFSCIRRIYSMKSGHAVLNKMIEDIQNNIDNIDKSINKGEGDIDDLYKTVDILEAQQSILMQARKQIDEHTHI